jgi:rSAM/selenodomain-associated transferase 1
VADRRPWLIVMVKVPRPGRVKTRLGRGIGLVAAAWWYRHQCARLIRLLGRDPRWRLVLAVAPDAEGQASRVWAGGVLRQPQGRGDLGRRMLGLLARAPGAAVLVGSDIPDLKATHVARAFAALGPADIVFGPAEDGGYWLIGRAAGMRPHSGTLDGVRWSGPEALAQSVAAFAGRRVALVDTLRDVDAADDL